MKIHVTQEDINNGAQNDCCYCPVARAVFRATKFASVEDGVIEYRCGRFVSQPKSVRDFVSAFDAGEPVSPFTFELEVDS